MAETKDMKMTSINFAQKAYNENDYPNARTEMYLELAKEIRNGFWVCDEVKNEILAMQVEINKKGQRCGRCHFWVRDGKAWGVQVYTRVYQRAE